MIQARTIISELKKFVAEYTNAAAAAKALGVTPAQLSTTLNKKVNVIPAKILKKLGYEARLVYLPVGKKGKRVDPMEGLLAAIEAPGPMPAIVHRTPVAPKPIPPPRAQPETQFIDVLAKDGP